MIEEAKCGFSVSAGDSKALAELIVQLASMPESELISLGENGKKFSDEHFAYDKCINHLVEILG